MREHPTPRKSLGQNWLHDPSSIGRILDWAASCCSPGWLEIGCGPGTLTRPLLASGVSVLGVELDPRMHTELHPDFAVRENSSLWLKDVLKIQESDVLEVLPTPYGVIGNLPYYITAPILEHVLLNFSQFTVFGLMVQKEVAQRMLAKPSTAQMSRLSVLVQLVCETSRLMTVKAGCFYPAPNVDSAFVVLRRRPGLHPTAIQKALALCRLGFSQRRKMLKGRLKGEFGVAGTDAAFEEAGIADNSRPQDLSPEQWLELARIKEHFKRC